MYHTTVPCVLASRFEHWSACTEAVFFAARSSLPIIVIFLFPVRFYRSRVVLRVVVILLPLLRSFVVLKNRFLQHLTRSFFPSILRRLLISARSLFGFISRLLIFEIFLFSMTRFAYECDNIIYIYFFIERENEKDTGIFTFIIFFFL